jgi:outer membrane lipoprotein-sorting protein
VRWISLIALLTAFSPPGAQTVGPATPDEVICQAEARFDALTDYECVADMESSLGQRSEAGSHRIWFKKPRMLRVRILRGRGRGVEFAVDYHGKMRGHQGGLLKAIVVEVSVKDPRIRSIRGVPVTEADWGSFYHKYWERSARPDARATLAPRGEEQAPYEVSLSYTDGEKRMREIYRIDPRLWVMVEGEVYEDEVRVDHVVFREIKLNTGVEDRWFKL